jgi:CHAT domain-containing protein/tetratricopeptide (TPR) repeat protein
MVGGGRGGRPAGGRVAALIAALLLACTGRSQRLEELFTDARTTWQTGQLLTALELTRKGKALAPGRADADSWRFLLLEAEILQMRGEPAAVEALVKAPPPPALAVGAMEARRQKILARLLISAGQRDQGLRHVERAEQLLGAGGAPELAIELVLLRGRVHIEQAADAAEKQRGEALFRRAEEMALAAGLPYWRATALIHLGFQRMSAQEHDQALAIFETAVQVARSIGAEALAATAAKNAGECLVRLGQLERGGDLLRQAVATHERLGSIRLQQAALGQLGMAQAGQGDQAGALASWRKALELARAHGASYAPIWAQSAAATLIQQGNWPEARRLNDEALRRASERGDLQPLLFARLNEARIAVGTGELERAEPILKEVLARATALRSLRWEAKAQLAELEVRRGRDGEAKRWFGQALAEVVGAQDALASEEHRVSFLAALIRFHRRYVDWLVGRGAMAEALEVAEANRARVLQARLGRGKTVGPLTADELRGRARTRGELFLSYWVGPQRSYGWLVTPTGIEMATLPGEHRLQELVEGYRQAIEQGMRDPLEVDGSPGRELHRVLVAPFRGALAAGSRLVVVPDGPLHALPFAALIVADEGAAPRYLVDDLTLARAPSLVLLPERPDRGVDLRGSAALALGAPVTRDASFARLPHAEEDLRAVARSFPATATRTLAGAEATPEGFLGADLGRFGVIHIAAHALVNPASPLDANVVLSPGPAGDRLGVRDLMVAPIRAQLVTISACRSAGAGAYAGEGLVGLAWAVLNAGAERVIAGLWDVPDQSTGSLMSALYANLASGKDPVAALRDAQRALLHDSQTPRRPWHWAAFEVWLGAGARPASAEMARSL